jgi:hypothetical protein
MAKASGIEEGDVARLAGAKELYLVHWETLLEAGTRWSEPTDRVVPVCAFSVICCTASRLSDARKAARASQRQGRGERRGSLLRAGGFSSQDGEGAQDPLESRQLARCFACIPPFLLVKGDATLSAPSQLQQLLELIAYELAQGTTGSETLVAAAAAFESIIHALVAGKDDSIVAAASNADGKVAGEKKIRTRDSEKKSTNSEEDREDGDVVGERDSGVGEAPPAVTREVIIDRVVEVIYAYVTSKTGPLPATSGLQLLGSLGGNGDTGGAWLDGPGLRLAVPGPGEQGADTVLTTCLALLPVVITLMPTPTSTPTATTTTNPAEYSTLTGRVGSPLPLAGPALRLCLHALKMAAIEEEVEATAVLATLTKVASVVREAESNTNGVTTSDSVAVTSSSVVSTEILRLAEQIEKAVAGGGEVGAGTWDELRGARLTRLLVALCELARGEAAVDADVGDSEGSPGLGAAEGVMAACGDVLTACLTHGAARVRGAAASALETTFFAEQARKPDTEPTPALRLVLSRVQSTHARLHTSI